MIAREPAPLGEALGEALRRDGVELVLGVQATSAAHDGEDFVLQLEAGSGAARHRRDVRHRGGQQFVV